MATLTVHHDRRTNHDWLSKSEAQRRLAASPKIFARLVASKSIAVRRLPGALPRYSASDVDRLVERFTTPATVRQARD